MEKIVKTVLQLSFFADRFKVAVSRLNWGILEAKNEDCETTMSPVVIIKDSNLFVNILSDKLEPMINIAGCESVAYVAEMEVISGGHLFVADDCKKIEIKDEEIFRIYRTKIFSNELEKEALYLS